MNEAAAPSGSGGLEGSDLPDQWMRNESPTDGP
jgi:hypothetical protein